ncbi:hypothetical protein BGZ89_008963 [Linnemannia elongata]|nr:hypothetical protein BGZ89_008963 [Linnemannia elongata]
MALQVPKPTARISMLYVPPEFHALLVNRSPLSIVEIRFFRKQLVAGLGYIHKAGIYQCDLKPENVLVDRGMQLKIIAFRLSEELFVRSDWTAGMPGYWASKVLEGKVPADKIDIPHIEVFRDRKTGVQHFDARVEPIAEGNFGTVYEVIDREWCKAALKVPKPTANLKMVTASMAMFYGEADGVRSPFLLLELYQSSDVFVLLVNRAPLPAEEIRFFGRQLFEGLAHIIQAGVRHSYLKPENVLVGVGMQLNISDFGLAEISGPNVIRTRKAGTPGYWAQEVLERMPHTDKIDVFALDVMFYTMFTRKLLNITAGNDVIFPPKGYLEVFALSDDARNLLFRTLMIDAEKRICVHDLVEHDILRRGVCPKSLPNTTFDVKPSVEEKSDAQDDDGGLIKQHCNYANAVSKAKDSLLHVTVVTPLGVGAYRKHMIKTEEKDRELESVLAKVQQIEKERDALRAEGDGLREIFGNDFCDGGRDDSGDGGGEEEDDDDLASPP